MWLDTNTSMKSGTLAGGGDELPVSVVQLIPQSLVSDGSGEGSGMSSNPAKPFIEFGAGPPDIWLTFAHWLPHHRSEALVPVASRSPTTNVPPFDVGKAATTISHVAVVDAPPSSLIIVVIVNGPVDA